MRRCGVLLHCGAARALLCMHALLFLLWHVPALGGFATCMCYARSELTACLRMWVVQIFLWSNLLHQLSFLLFRER